MRVVYFRTAETKAREHVVDRTHAVITYRP